MMARLAVLLSAVLLIGAGAPAEASAPSAGHRRAAKAQAAAVTRVRKVANEVAASMSSLRAGAARSRRQSIDDFLPAGMKSNCGGLVDFLEDLFKSAMENPGQELDLSPADMFKHMNLKCSKYLCSNGGFDGAFGGMTGAGADPKPLSAACTDICVNTYATMGASAREKSKMMTMMEESMTDGGSDSSSSGEVEHPTCLVQEAATKDDSLLSAAEEFCGVFEDRHFVNLYKLMYDDKNSQCGMFTESCSRDSDCDASEDGFSQLCVAGACTEKCRTTFVASFSGSGVWCDPCSEKCSGGYCQSTDPTEIKIEEMDPDTFISVVKTICHVDANTGDRCAKDLKAVEEHDPAGSGTFTVPVGGDECTPVELYGPGQTADLTAAVSTDSGSLELKLTEYLGGDCTEAVVVHTVPIGASCTKVTSEFSPFVNVNLFTQKGITVDSFLGAAVYAVVEQTNSNVSVQWSTNADCSAVSSAFTPAFCAKIDNEFDAGSCCMKTIEQAYKCLDPSENGLGSQISSYLTDAKAACGKPGNSAVCAGVELPSSCVSADQLKAKAESIKVKVAGSQASQWNFMDASQKKQAAAGCLGLSADQVTDVVVTDGEVQLNILANDFQRQKAERNLFAQAGQAKTSGADVTCGGQQGAPQASFSADALQSAVPPPPPPAGSAPSGAGSITPAVATAVALAAAAGLLLV